MALHGVCPVQRSHGAHLDARTRSVSARACPGAPPYCPMQELSRTPQTRPTNDRPPTQTCWSAACAYARRRGKCLYLEAMVAAGEPREPGTDNPNDAKGAGHLAVHMQHLARALLNQGTYLGESPQKPQGPRASVR